MKADKFRELDTKELELKDREMQDQLFHLRFQLAMGQSEGLKKYRAMKKDRARVLSILREQELKPAKAKEKGK